jgi:enterochelin esterase-like enzyme
MKRVAVVVGLAWLIVGLVGAFSYAHNYYVYRGFTPPHDPPHVQVGKAVVVSFRSRALRARRSYVVYLPAGYAAAAARGARFPALYLLHGTPGGPRQFLDIARVGVLQDMLLARGQAHPFLIVMPDGRDGSYASDTEWADTRHGRYESFVLDVVHDVDTRWPTLPDRAHRGIAGNSEGAYGAMNVGLRHLGTFGVIEAWSGYYVQTRSGPFRHAPPALVRANGPARYVASLAPRLRRDRVQAFVYTGDGDEYRAQSLAFAHALAEAGGWVSFADFHGRHDWRLWRQHAPAMLRFADRWLSPGAVV